MYRTVEEAKIEDPLEALLNLAGATRARLRQLEFLTAYGLLSGLIAAAVLLPMGAVGLVLRGTEPLYVVGIAAGSVSIAAAILAYRIDRFFSYFDRRLRAIEGFVRSDPNPPIPEGDDAASRAAAWLERTDDRFRLILSRARDRLVRDARPLGPESLAFAVHFLRRSTYLPRQYHLLVHVLDRPIGIDDLRRVKDAAEQVAVATRVPPDRVLVVQSVPSEIPDEVERWIDDNWILAPRGRRAVERAPACAIQLLVEREDGRYDLSPPFAG